MLDRFFDRLTRGIVLVLALAFIAAVLLNCINVVGRYVIGKTILWADEVQVFIMIWMAFLGAVVASWQRMHLRMDMLLKMFSPGVQHALRLAELTLLATLSGLILYESSSYAAQMFTLDRVSDVAQIPMWIPHGGVALGFGLIGLIAVVQLWRSLRGQVPGAVPEDGETR